MGFIGKDLPVVVRAARIGAIPVTGTACLRVHTLSAVVRCPASARITPTVRVIANVPECVLVADHLSIHSRWCGKTYRHDECNENARYFHNHLHPSMCHIAGPHTNAPPVHDLTTGS